MPAGLQFVVETLCLVGLTLLAAPAAWLVVGRSFTLAGWLRIGLVLIVAVESLAAFGSGSAVIFQVVVGTSIFFAVLLGVAFGAAVGWRRLRNRGGDRIESLAAKNFAGALMWGVGAAACAAIALWFVGSFLFVAGRQLGFQMGLDPKCSSLCVEHSSAVLVRNWVESSTGAHWIQVRGEGRTQNIEVDPKGDGWVTLSGGQQVGLTSWRGTVTEVTVPVMGEMEATNGPFSTKLPGGVLFVFGLPSLLAFPIFLGGAVFYRRQWRRTLTRADPEAMVA